MQRYKIIGWMLILFLALSFIIIPEKAEAKVKSIQFKTKASEVSVGLNESKMLGINVKPASAKKEVSFKSKNPKILSVKKSGRITGKKVGTTYVYAKATDSSKKKVKIKVRVLRKVKEIKFLNSQKNKTVKRNSTFIIEAAVLPKTATKKQLKWSTSSKKTATVNENGQVIAKNAGTAIIKASAIDGSGKSVTCKLKVVIPVTSIKLSSKRKDFLVEKGTELKMKASCSPSNANNKSVTWKSSNTSIATVDSSGAVLGKKVGTVTVTATAKDGSGIKAKETVTVISISRNETHFIAHRGFSSEAPGNSLAAFELAAKNGFWGVECDVWETADGEFAIVHDETLLNITGVDKRVTDMTLEEIQAKNIIVGNGIEDYPNEKVPTLEQYLEVLSKYSDVKAVIELKMVFTEESLDRIVEMVKSYGMEDRVIYISFMKENLTYLKTKDPSYDLQYIVRALSEEDMEYCLDNEIDVSFKAGMVSLEQIQTLKNAGRKVSVWTVNDVYTAYDYIKNYQVDYLTTDFFLFEP